MTDKGYWSATKEIISGEANFVAGVGTTIRYKAATLTAKEAGLYGMGLLWE